MIPVFQTMPMISHEALLDCQKYESHLVTRFRMLGNAIPSYAQCHYQAVVTSVRVLENNIASSLQHLCEALESPLRDAGVKCALFWCRVCFILVIVKRPVPLCAEQPAIWFGNMWDEL